MPWTREEKYFASQIFRRKNHSKLSKKTKQNATYNYNNDLLLRK